MSEEKQGGLDPGYGVGKLPCPYCGFEAKENEVFTSPTRRSNVFGAEWWCENCGKNFQFDAIASSWSFMSTPYDNPQVNLGHEERQARRNDNEKHQ